MLDIALLVLTPLVQNCKILMDRETGESVIVDPSVETESILQRVVAESTKCFKVWLTHSHLDHCGGVVSLRKEIPFELLAHRDDAALRLEVENDAEYFGLSPSLYRNCPEPDHFLEDDEIPNVGRHEFRVVHRRDTPRGMLRLTTMQRES